MSPFWTPVPFPPYTHTEHLQEVSDHISSSHCRYCRSAFSRAVGKVGAMNEVDGALFRLQPSPMLLGYNVNTVQPRTHISRLQHEKQTSACQLTRPR